MNRPFRTVHSAIWFLLAGSLCASLPAQQQAAEPADADAARLARLAALERAVANAKPAAAPATKPAAAPATKPAEGAVPKLNEAGLLSRRNSRDNSRNNTAGLPDAGEVSSIDQLVQLTQDRGILKLDVTPLATSTSQRFRVKGLNSVFTLYRNGSSIQTSIVNGVVIRQQVTNVSVTRTDFDVNNDTDYWSTSAHSNGSYVSFSGQTVLGQVTFSQSTAARPAGLVGAANVQPVNLYVYEYANAPAGAGFRLNSTFRGGAKSVIEMRAKYPDEFRKYVVPLISKFSDMSWLCPGAADVYSVFTEIAADPQVTAKLDALLPDLDSDAFHVREAAGKQLLELGAPGVLAALRKDMPELSDEQRAQLGRLIAAHRRRPDTTTDARNDPAFLADCLEHTDPAVRQAAKSALEKVLGESLTFDPSLNGEELAKSADVLRKKIVQKQAAAATQPAAEGEGAAQEQVLPRPALIRPQIMLR